MKKLLPAFLVFLLCLPVSAQEFLDITEEHTFAFPGAFFYQKDYRVQWWYVTGHLYDDSGREFGYELTFFVVGVQKKDYTSRFGVNTLYISHFAVSDIAKNTFYFSEKTDTGAFGFAGASDTQLKVWVDSTVLEGSPAKMHLRAEDREKRIDLHLVPLKPVVLHGEHGYSRKSDVSPLLASFYFSFSSLHTEGTLRMGGDVFTVKGKSWFDREISSRGLDEKLAGWDWFSVQLDDNRELMLYLMRNKDGTLDRSSSGTFIDHNGKYRHLSRDRFSVRVRDHYKSSKTGARYPSRWEITVPSEHISITVIPLLADQEVLAYNSTGNYYWEGACRVEGSAKGRAYVEMTGY